MWGALTRQSYAYLTSELRLSRLSTACASVPDENFAVGSSEHPPCLQPKVVKTIEMQILSGTLWPSVWQWRQTAKCSTFWLLSLYVWCNMLRLRNPYRKQRSRWAVGVVLRHTSSDATRLHRHWQCHPLIGVGTLFTSPPKEASL